ncbi:MAG: ferrochelatase, partial [Nitrospiraceae bacterium]
ITMAQAGALEKILGVKVYVGMRYWRPFIEDTVEEIINDGVDNLIVLSMYPHYSKATTGSSVAEFKRAISRGKGQGARGKGRQDIQIQYIKQWYDFPPYIDALAELIAEGLEEFRGHDFDILYSAHSLPQSFIDEGDPYLEHIKSTISAVNSLLLNRRPSPLRWHLAFQSKTGPVKWLEPTTEETLKKLADAGCRNLFVVPVSFVSDHIETLYEIDILYKNLAEKHGINLKRCRALNTSGKFILALKELILEKQGSRGRGFKGEIRL